MDPLDRELASLLSVEPSPEFRARVRTRVASEPAPREGFQRWRVVAAAAVAAISFMIAVILTRSEIPGNTQKDVAAPASSAVASGLSRTTDLSRTTETTPRVVAPVSSGVEARRGRREYTAPEVLVAPSEKRGLRQLAAIVREGRTQFVFSEDIQPAAQEPVREIVVAPIAIAPIEVATHAGSAGDAEGDGP